MGLFNFFKRNDKIHGIDSVIIGYLRTETSKHLGHPLGSKEYEAACASAVEHVNTALLPALALDKRTQQEVVDTLSENCGDRFKEAFGEYLILLWVRLCIIQKAIAQGQVKPEEATVSVLSQALQLQIKRLVETKPR